MRKRKSATSRVRSDTSHKHKKKAAVKKKKARVTRVPKTRNAGKWTESQFWQAIRAALRQKSRFWTPRLKALEKAKRPNQSTNKRLKWEFQCSKCKNWFPAKSVEVHHSVPAGSLNCYADLPGFVERLFAEEGWEVICRICHKKEHEK